MIQTNVTLQAELEVLRKEKAQILEDHRQDLARQLEELRKTLEHSWAERLE